MTYYPDYVPANQRHFDDMLDQFRKAKARGAKELQGLVALWTFDRGVDRQDIVVALGRIERE